MTNVKKTKSKPLPGTPFSLVQTAEKDGLIWLRQLPERARLLRAMRTDMDEFTKVYLSQAEIWGKLALQSIKRNSDDAPMAAMRALQHAWYVECALGIAPKVQRAIADHKSKTKLRGSQMPRLDAWLLEQDLSLSALELFMKLPKKGKLYAKNHNNADKMQVVEIKKDKKKIISFKTFQGRVTEAKDA